MLKEVKLEFRDKSAIASILLYMVSTLFICYQSFRTIKELPIWVALLWIIFLFTGVNAVSRSFYHENRGRQFYLYTLASPQAVVLSKMLYNFLLLLAVNFFGFLLYYIFFGAFQLYLLKFFPILVLGTGGISHLLTFVAAISAKSSNTSGIVGVLSFPVILPLLLIILKATTDLAEGMTGSYIPYLLALVALNLVVVVLAFILFPYLWKE